MSVEQFNQWAKKPKFSLNNAFSEKKAIVYTRVSSKEQFDTNLSLDFQRKTCEEYAIRQKFEIVEFFGGVHESAKTDGRKEFQRMLDYARKNKKITHIFVYLLDRFSRTGGGAIKLAKDLREKYGITIVAVTQPIDTSNPGGVFQQNIQFLFSEYDNQLRRQRIMAGMKEKFLRGIWCIKPPMGYDIIYDKKGMGDERNKGERKIVLNETGKKLKKAFEWKTKGMKSEEIISRLQSYGVKIYSQKLSKIFSNPFYCGILSNKMLDGKVVEGKHEKMISQDVFLKVNEIRAAAGGKYGIVHQKEHDNVPLKVFMRCNDCGGSYTGYIVKTKGIWYYKCRTKGCCNNKNAKDVNNEFQDYLTNYSIAPHLVEPFLYVMKNQFAKLEENKDEEEKVLKQNLKDLQKKIDGIEEEYYITKSMPVETYQKFLTRFNEEKNQLLKNLEFTATNSSNHIETLSKVLKFSLKLPTVWRSANVNQKENLQKMIFPNGIIYERKNSTFRTEKVNEVFGCIAQLNSVSAENKKGEIKDYIDFALQVERTGFEPVIPP